VTAIDLAARVRSGEPRAVARAISLVENETAHAAPLIAALHPYTGHAYLVGITGQPGAGKSTLVDRLTSAWRREGLRVGVIAVDPTSPFTGGALLGDRVRMQQHAGDAGVFIRSMATRGHLGGLARATGDIAIVLDAAHYDLVLIETVGVGQDEVDVVRTADISVVVTVPGAGDEVQALKAGIMEIADIYVVNKADREGADRAVAAIEALLSLQTFSEGQWRPPVIRTEAITGAGLAELTAAVGAFQAHGADRLAARRHARAAGRVRDLLARQLLAHVEKEVLAPGEFEALLERIARRELDPHAAAAALVDRALGRGRPRAPHADAGQ
jgi:LAO/AO transport system kinase